MSDQSPAFCAHLAAGTCTVGVVWFGIGHGELMGLFGFLVRHNSSFMCSVFLYLHLFSATEHVSHGKAL